jgi:hypothetical protein
MVVRYIFYSIMAALYLVAVYAAVMPIQKKQKKMPAELQTDG